MINLKEVLERRGLKVVGPLEAGIGMDGGYLVATAVNSPKIEALPAMWNTTPSGPKHTAVWPKGEIEGLHRCGWCMQKVGTETDRFGTYVRAYKTYRKPDGSTGYSCLDENRCHQSVKDADAFGLAEAKAFFPEQEDEDEEDLNDVGEVVE